MKTKREEKSKTEEIEQIKNNLMVDFSTTIPTITLNINGLKIPIKSQISRSDVKIKTELYVNSKKATLNIKAQMSEK